MTNPPYHPIDCGLHDRLLAAATRGRTVQVRFRGDAGELLDLRSRILDVFSREGAEYLRTSEGGEIRLDRLLEVDGVPFSEGG